MGRVERPSKDASQPTFTPESRLSKEVGDGLAFAVFGDVEGAAFDGVFGFGADAHGCHDGGVEVHDGDRIFDGDEGAFVGGLAVDVAFFGAASKHDDAGATGEVAVEAVVGHFLKFVDFEGGLVVG